MEAAKSNCSICGSELGLPHNGSIVCRNCGARHGSDVSPGTQLSGSPILGASRSLNAPGVAIEGAEDLFAELDEKIDELAVAIEELRSREQGAPLELGCALFSVFSVTIIALAVFATVARSYFGGWLFYIVLSVVFLAGLYRIAPKIIAQTQLPRIARKRAAMEATLHRLRTQRKNLESLES